MKEKGASRILGRNIGSGEWTFANAAHVARKARTFFLANLQKDAMEAGQHLIKTLGSRSICVWRRTFGSLFA